MKKHLILSFAMLLFIGIASSAAYKIERLEPAFWWAGMEDENLQLLVYGENISELRPSIDYEGVSLERTVQVKSPNYLFLYLKIDKSVQPGAFDIAFKKKNKTQLSYRYELKQRRDGSAMRQGYTTSDVMYLITPDRFVNGDPSNDEVAGMKEGLDRSDDFGRHGGDLAGIINHLDYIEDMGYTALWLNPVMENDMPEGSYHGYAITDFYETDARHGSNEDYLKLSEELKKRDMKLVIDMIMNHCGSEHWWMKDLPTDDWLNFQDGWQVTTHLRETNMDPYASDYDKRNHADGWFVEAMPDLNQRNPLMADYLIYNTIWWIEHADLDGIRMDTYPYPDKDFMSEWTRRVMAEYPYFNIVGEEWSSNPAIVSYWQKGKHNPDGYVSYMPGVFDFPLQEALVKALNEDDSQWGQGLPKLYGMLANDHLYADPSQLVIFPDNHDMSRFYTQINEDFDLFKMGMAYIAVTRGIPQIYYGTEILMTNPNSDSHGEIRAEYPGGWADHTANAFIGEGLTADQKEAQAFTKTLLNWRKGSSAVHNGCLKHFAPTHANGLYTLFRYDDESVVMLVMNKNPEAKEVNIVPFKDEVIGTATQGTDVISGNKVSLAGETVNVGPRSFLLVEIKK
ncbi:glycoside hydrolase family 13 protein [Carboxylicivirga sediminis]|uniref:Glycoside hydrolase family 13 protein n=1 Tax=Carboxylicivirga sediminis TaxID=2006564 RepID=A0A941IY25_9BACT|nr:glycoside hydrolase family 13 protein [Carboxylicivirga sediminis]MBR8536565.1 glycoside hydrolase family 13 protein [Carboxylicivirga sediminis]